MKNLTKPQMEFLRDCARPRGTSCTQAYKPAKILAERGLIATDHHVPSSRTNANWWHCRITDAGRAALGSQ